MIYWGTQTYVKITVWFVFPVVIVTCAPAITRAKLTNCRLVLMSLIRKSSCHVQLINVFSKFISGSLNLINLHTIAYNSFNRPYVVVLHMSRMKYDFWIATVSRVLLLCLAWIVPWRSYSILLSYSGFV